MSQQQQQTNMKGEPKKMVMKKTSMTMGGKTAKTAKTAMAKMPEGKMGMKKTMKVVKTPSRSAVMKSVKRTMGYGK
jgi:hypothetical protein